MVVHGSTITEKGMVRQTERIDLGQAKKWRKEGTDGRKRDEATKDGQKFLLLKGRTRDEMKTGLKRKKLKVLYKDERKGNNCYQNK